MRKFSVTTIFWALVGVFVVIVSDMMLVPLFPTALWRAYLIPLMFISWIAFFLLGLVLIILVVKKKVEGLLKRFLLLTGASAVGFLPFVVLHNAVSALFGIEEPFFFILAVFICPLGFLVGATGTIVFLKKGKRQ